MVCSVCYYNFNNTANTTMTNIYENIIWRRASVRAMNYFNSRTVDYINCGRYTKKDIRIARECVGRMEQVAEELNVKTSMNVKYEIKMRMAMVDRLLKEVEAPKAGFFEKLFGVKPSRRYEELIRDTVAEFIFQMNPMLF